MLRLENRLLEDIDDFDPNVVWHTERWCHRYYHESGQGPLLRWSIGVYQLHQLRVAGSDQERRRSAAAAITLHAIAAAASIGADVLPHLPSRWSLLDEMPWVPDEVLRWVTSATQQYCYLTTCKPGTVRYGRIDKVELTRCTARLAAGAMCRLPAFGRGGAPSEEMDRLTAFEWKSK